MSFNEDSIRNHLLQTTGQELNKISTDSISSIQDQLSIINKSIDSFNELSKSVEQMEQSSNLSASRINEVTSGAIKSSEELKEVVQKMGKLEEDLNAISSLVKTINTIAEQTNLLSLNATIEAARAGEAGKGFAVVASEVKELSKTTKKANEEINNVVTKISTSARQLSQSLELTVTTIDTSLKQISEANASINQIQNDSSGCKYVTKALEQDFRSLLKNSNDVETDSRELKTIGLTIDALLNLLKEQGAFDLKGVCPLDRIRPLTESSNFADESRFTQYEEEYNLMEDEVLISSTDCRGIITFANSSFYDVAQYDFGTLINKPHNTIRHPDMPKTAFKDLWDTIKSGHLWQGYVLNKGALGRKYWVLATVFPVYENGKISGYISVRNKPSSDKIREAIKLYRLLP